MTDIDVPTRTSPPPVAGATASATTALPHPLPPHPLPPAAVAGALAAVGLLSMLYVLPRRPSTFLMTFWALSYQRGYRARALPASLLQWLGVDHVTVRLVTWVSCVLLLALLALLVVLATRAYRARPGWPTLLLGLLLVGSPATLRSTAFELATLDNLVLVLTLGGLCLLRPAPRTGRLLAVGGLATLTVLVHEASVLLTLPLLLAAVVAASAGVPWPRAAARVAVVATGPALALLWVVSAPVIPGSEVPARLAEVQQVAEVDRDDTTASWAIRNHTRDLGADVRHTATQLRERGHGRHAIALAACLPSLAAAVLLGRDVVPRHRRRLVLALGAGVATAPLLLAPVGHDWGRWIAYSTFGVVVGVTWLAGRATRPAPSWAVPGGVLATVTVTLVAVSLMTPPLARGGSFRVRVGQPAEVVKLLLGW